MLDDPLIFWISAGFCYWTLIWLSLNWAWACQGYCRYRSLMNWLIDWFHGYQCDLTNLIVVSWPYAFLHYKDIQLFTNTTMLIACYCRQAGSFAFYEGREYLKVSVMCSCSIYWGMRWVQDSICEAGYLIGINWYRSQTMKCRWLCQTRLFYVDLAIHAHRNNISQLSECARVWATTGYTLSLYYYIPPSLDKNIA